VEMPNKDEAERHLIFSRACHNVLI
jgi:hypothetical protein